MFGWSGATPESHEAPRRRQPLDHVHLDGKSASSSWPPRRTPPGPSRRPQREADGPRSQPDSRGGRIRHWPRELQWLQPQPQPPAACGSSPPSTSSFAWKDEPQPQDATTFGFSIENPPPMSASTKSISAPIRYGALYGSTTIRTPCDLELVVAVLRTAIEAERVLEAGAAATLDSDPKHLRLFGGLLGRKFLELLRCFLGQASPRCSLLGHRHVRF